MLASFGIIIAGTDCQPAWRADFLATLYRGSGICGDGYRVISDPGSPLQAESKLTKEGVLAGFLAGLMVIIGNPKAMLFYIGILPGFFDVSRLQMADIAVIALISALAPFTGNLILGLAVGRARQLISSVCARRRLNQGSGIILIAVGGLILVTV